MGLLGLQAEGPDVSCEASFGSLQYGLQIKDPQERIRAILGKAGPYGTEPMGRIRVPLDESAPRWTNQGPTGRIRASLMGVESRGGGGSPSREISGERSPGSYDIYLFFLKRIKISHFLTFSK